VAVTNFWSAPDAVAWRVALVVALVALEAGPICPLIDESAICATFSN